MSRNLSSDASKAAGVQNLASAASVPALRQAGFGVDAAVADLGYR